MVEVEGQDTEGQTIKAVLVSLKPSNLPSVSTFVKCGFTNTVDHVLGRVAPSATHTILKLMVE